MPRRTPISIDVPVTGTDHAQVVYDTWCRSGGAAPGSELSLRRDHENYHDKWAVKVMRGGLQMGWVGRTHSERVAKMLDSGERLDRIAVVYNSPGSPAMKRLVIRLLFEDQALPGTPRHIVKVFGANSESSATLEYLNSGLKKLPVGSVLDTDSNNNRTSIDIIFKTRRIAWFRKEEPGNALSSSLVVLANRGALVARIESQNPLTMSLHRKGDIKSPEIESPAERVIATELAYGLDPKITGSLSSINNPSITPKETTMNTSTLNNFFSNLLSRNTKAAADAAYLETGRIANNTVAKIVIGRLPFMARFAAKTPLGKLAIANAAMILAQQVRPNDERLKKLSGAMTTVAYQELIALVDVEGMVDEFLAHPALKRALEKQEPVSAEK